MAEDGLELTILLPKDPECFDAIMPSPIEFFFLLTDLPQQNFTQSEHGCVLIHTVGNLGKTLYFSGLQILHNEYDDTFLFLLQGTLGIPFLLNI